MCATTAWQNSVGSAKVKSVYLLFEICGANRNNGGHPVDETDQGLLQSQHFLYFLKTTASAVFGILLSSFQEGLSEVTAQHLPVCQYQ